MAHCDRCGQQTPNRTTCDQCMSLWSDASIKLYREAEAKYGIKSPKIQEHVDRAINKAKKTHGGRWWEAILPKQ